MYFNQVLLAGHVGKDPETKVYDKKDGSGDKGYITTFSLAIGEGFGENKKTTWVPCKAFDKQAYNFSKHVITGSNIFVIGSFHTESYTNKDGKKITRNMIIVNRWMFCATKKDSGGVSGADTASEAPKDGGDGFMNIPDGIDEELPFV